MLLPRTFDIKQCRAAPRARTWQRSRRGQVYDAAPGPSAAGAADAEITGRASIPGIPGKFVEILHVLDLSLIYTMILLGFS